MLLGAPHAGMRGDDLPGEREDCGAEGRIQCVIRYVSGNNAMTKFLSPHKHTGGTRTRQVGSNTERPWAVIASFRAAATGIKRSYLMNNVSRGT